MLRDIPMNGGELDRSLVLALTASAYSIVA
jgi:hypothetical protein